MAKPRSWQRHLAARLVLYFLALFLGAVALLGTVTYLGSVKALETAVFGQLEVEATLESQALGQWVEEEKRELRLFTDFPPLRDGLEQLVGLEPDDPGFRAAYDSLDLLAGQVVPGKSEWRELLVLSAEGRVLFSTEKAHEDDYRTLDTYFVEGLAGPYASKVYASVPSHAPTLTLSLPIDGASQAIGVLALHLDLGRLDQILEGTGLGEGGESYLVDSVNVLISGRRFGSEEFRRGVHSEGIEAAIAGRDGSGTYTNYRGVEVLGVYRHVEALGAALLVEIPEGVIHAPTRELLGVIFGVGLGAALVLTLGTFLLANQVARPILAVRDAAVRVAEGDLGARAPVTTEDEVGTLARAFNEMAERTSDLIRRLKHVDELKDEFLANTSHELRTPLYGITGLAESLLDGAAGEVSEPVKADLAMIAASGRRLGHLVNDILDFSKLRHQSLELRRRPVDLRSVAEVVLTLSRPLVGKKELELRNAVPGDLPPVDADEDRLQQVLYNLVGNAIKFTGSGSVEVSAAVEGDGLGVRVADTGIGIDAVQQERIFGAFEQADASVEREYGGTGLGLAVTAELVALHGGTIGVDSQPGQGSTFHFTLPLARGERPATAAGVDGLPGLGSPVVLERPVVPAASTRGGQPAARLLAVDDEPVNLQVLRNYLALENFEIVLASSGPEALEKLGEQSFDLVLLDVMMPKMSGYEVCRIIRQSHPPEELPIVFLSALDRSEERIAGLEHGGNDYLDKPIAQGELLARVRTHLELLAAHRRQGQELDQLRGLLPICMRCKKIRDEEGDWNQLEAYISQHSEAEFSHGVCPSCAQIIYAEDGGW